MNECFWYDLIELNDVDSENVMVTQTLPSFDKAASLEHMRKEAHFKYRNEWTKI